VAAAMSAAFAGESMASQSRVFAADNDGLRIEA